VPELLHLARRAGAACCAAAGPSFEEGFGRRGSWEACDENHGRTIAILTGYSMERAKMITPLNE